MAPFDGPNVWCLVLFYNSVKDYFLASRSNELGNLDGVVRSLRSTGNAFASNELAAM